MKVKALKSFENVVDTQVGRVRKENETFEVSDDRARILLDHKLVIVVEELNAHVNNPKEPVVESATLEPKDIKVPKTKEVKYKKNYRKK